MTISAILENEVSSIGIHSGANIPRATRSYQKLPEATRSYQKLPEAVRKGWTSVKSFMPVLFRHAQKEGKVLH